MTKYWISWALAVLGAYALGCMWGASDARADVSRPCNQKMYDYLYYSIVQEALKSKKSEEDAMKLRNTRIRTLRDLCNGQRSTFENPLPKGK